MSLTTEQVEARRRSIGSTDIAAVVALYRPELAHLSKYRNATDVWMRLVYGTEQPHRAAMSRGHKVEPLLRTLYRETIGPVEDPPGTLRHPRFDWAVGSPDGLTATELVEFKSASNWIRSQWGEPGSDKCPDSYGLQVQWLMECAQRSVAHVLVAFGDDFKNEGADDFSITETAVYRVPKDEALVTSMLECGEKFYMEHVVARVPPVGLPPMSNKREFRRRENERAANG